MGEKIIIGPYTKGLRNDVTAFNVDQDAFPQLINAYQWRGRVKRKRGTSLLGRLTRYFDSTSTSFNPGTSSQTLDGSGNGNLLTGFTGSLIEAAAAISPTSVTITAGSNIYTDPAANGTLSGPNPGSINYATGAITIAAEAGHSITAQFNYYPSLPVLGLESVGVPGSGVIGCLAFDDTYAYNIAVTARYTINAVNFYTNPASSSELPGYIPKSTWSSLKWNGENYQQFWSCNYDDSCFITNGIPIPFVNTHIGMQYKAITGVTVSAAGPPAIATLSIAAHGLKVGDFLFLNEIGGITGINFQTCYVVAVPGINSVQVEFPLAVLGGSYSSGGIAQYLTNNANPSLDCLRYYMGSPVSGTVPPIFSNSGGWVNYCPPLSNLNYSIGGLPEAQYYLVGARMIVSFKDRLLFIGPIVQTSAASSAVFLQDTVIFSWNGTPYYTASFNGAPSAATIYQPMLTPANQSANPQAFWEDQTGLGGFITAGFESAINTVSPNEDVLIMGFGNRQARFAYTGWDLLPFAFYVINSELGSTSTFSIINLDRGVITMGQRGVVITSQTESKRIDLDIPDQIFELSLPSNGAQRVSAQRDYINEWVYFSYRSNASNVNIYQYPTQTLFYNYRDGTWALFNETYTTYGLFRRKTGFTWQTIGQTYSTWNNWTDPWNAGSSTLLQPEVVAGNQQGFVVTRGIGTSEATSLYIEGFSGDVVTSPDHCLSNGDYVVISGCLGVSGVNGIVFQVFNVTQNTFSIDATITGTYLGGGLITRMYVPFIQSKQFPVNWNQARKTRLGPQMYLLTTTDNAQVSLLIYLSQDGASPYNIGSIVPTTIPVPDNNSLIYSSILYTCPESTNLGLTPSNINLQMVTGIRQSQIWHRINTSLLGDTVQFAITLSDVQMNDPTLTYQFAEIELHAVVLDVSPSQLLS